MADMMTFPETVEEFMDQYKVVDTEHVYTNGTELVPIYRMKQWFEHETHAKRTEAHECDNQHCIQNGGDICDRVHCPIGQKQTFYDDITDEQEQLDFVQKHERMPVTLNVEPHGDVISRQAAIDIFDPWLKVKGYSDGELNMLKAVLYELRFLPSAEPEIIRCCKCIHWKQDTVRQNSNDVSWWNEAICDRYSDDIWTAWKDADWYCADAERRTDEETDIS